ncbi:MAG: rod shape-determining protein MreD [Actinomycetia bacterium]|nr:rod shape-determining protein MreD [Actinomycetes bacterium]
MSRSNNLLVTIIGSLIALILQVTLSSNLAIAGATMEISLVFVAANAFRTTRLQATLAGFILGLLVDLACGTPLGVRALAYCLVAFVVNSLGGSDNLSSLLLRYLLLILAVLAGELGMAVLMSIIGYDSDILYTLVSQTLPGSLYNAVIALPFLLWIRPPKAPKAPIGRTLKHTSPRFR